MLILKIILYLLLAVLILLAAYIILLVITAYVFPCDYSDHNSRYHRFLINSSVGLVCIFARIHLHVEGMDKVPQGTRFLLVSNHRSKFDPLLEWYVFRKYDIAFVSKPANFKVPAYGHLIRRCCFMPIDREDPAKAAATLKRAENLIRSDEVSVGVYPEGTRGDGRELLPFHNGMFHIAKSTHIPIVVVSLKNTADIAKHFPLKGTHVYMEVTDVIPADFIADNRTNAIGDRVRSTLEPLYPMES